MALTGVMFGARAARGAPPPTLALAWKLAPSDVAVYDVAPVTFTAAGDAKGTSVVRTVDGHEIRAGQYQPTSARADALLAILGLHLPTGLPAGLPAGLAAAPTPQTCRLDLADAADVAAKGTASATVRADGFVDVTYAWTFDARGALDKDVRLVVDEGTADGTRTFDPVRGVVTAARVRMSARRRMSSDGKAAPAGRADGV